MKSQSTLHLKNNGDIKGMKNYVLFIGGNVSQLQDKLKWEVVLCWTANRCDSVIEWQCDSEILRFWQTDRLI